MPRYLVQASYSAQGMSALTKNPHDRSATIRRLVEGLGGKVEDFNYSFGDYDVAIILELPDNTTMAGFAMAAGASGAVSNIKTTVLISMDEAIEAMQQAGSKSPWPPYD